MCFCRCHDEPRFGPSRRHRRAQGDARCHGVGEGRAAKRGDDTQDGNRPAGRGQRACRGADRQPSCDHQAAGARPLRPQLREARCRPAGLRLRRDPDRTWHDRGRTRGGQADRGTEAARSPSAQGVPGASGARRDRHRAGDQGLAPEILLADLSLEFDAVGSMLCHGPSSSESPAARSITESRLVRPEGPTPPMAWFCSAVDTSTRGSRRGARARFMPQAITGRSTMPESRCS